MGAKELFQAGKLDEAVQALGVEVRDNPTDVRRRTFLFELLCFQGQYDRAEKHLNVLADASPDARMGALVYLSALHAERLRQEMFEKKEYPETAALANDRGGTVDGTPFESFVDADPRIGARLELYAAGAYLWIPLAHVESIEMEAPKRLRDLLWIPALVRTGPAFRGTELGEVLLPVLAPHSFRHADQNVRLGRATDWEQSGEAQIPSGQRVFEIDGVDVPILEIRKVEFAPAALPAPAVS